VRRRLGAHTGEDARDLGVLRLHDRAARAARAPELDR
jgi:hypothetical protein